MASMRSKAREERLSLFRQTPLTLKRLRFRLRRPSKSSANWLYL